MKKSLFLLFAWCVATVATAQQKARVYAVGFYNQENLFDTCHDAGKKDYDFLPGGSYKWDGLKYGHKLRNMARALADMGTDVLPHVGCAVIGLSEVENRRVLEDLVRQQPLAERGYAFAHIEGSDRRGIDCALLYNPQLFTKQTERLVPYMMREAKDSAFFTRGFFIVTGELAGEPVAFIVCHLPSRFSGSSYREWGATQVRAVKDSLLAINPAMKVMVMGDMNDDPSDNSMRQCLSAKAEVAQVGPQDMYNPWYNMLVKQGTGTLQYRGAWNLFDQIILSPNLLNAPGTKDFPTLKFWKARIQRMPYLFETEGKYKGSPKRTTAGGVWLDGYSDHLPVCVYLVKTLQ